MNYLQMVIDFLRNPINIIILSGILVVLSIGFGHFVFPELLRTIIKSQIHLAEGNTRVRPMYVKIPFFLNFRIFFLNVTNKNEVMQGKKPKLQEVGPYFFEEWKEKFNLIDNNEEDTLTYHYKNTYIFRPDLSGNLTGDETIVIPHPLIAGVFLTANIDKQAMLPMIEEGVKNLFHDPIDPFYTGRAMDFLFDGIEIDCSKSETHAFTGAICMQLEELATVKKINDDRLIFSMFANMNATDLGEIKVDRGKKNYKNMGHVISINGETDAGVWRGDECNAFIGTDTTILPPLMAPDKGDVIWGYDPLICRSIGTQYTNMTTKYNGVPAFVYDLDISDPINAKQCFCRDEDTCPPHGSFDLYRCQGAPMFATLPHFYRAEQLLDGIESGLNPNKEDHELFVNLEIITGAPLSAAKRMQFNLEMKSIPDIEMMENMPEVMFPLFWVEESVYLKKDITNQLKFMHWAIILVHLGTWVSVGLGIFGILGSGAWMIISDED